MKKQTYSPPQFSLLEIAVEQGFQVSEPALWYEEGASGDFSYEFEKDDKWS